MKRTLYVRSRWVNFVFILSCFSTLISLYEVNNDNYNLMWMLPAAYCLLTILFRKMYEKPSYKYGVGFWSINVVMMVRYLITPIAIVVTNVYGRMGPTPASSYFTDAYILMIYEMLCAFCAIRILTSLLSKLDNKPHKREVDFFKDNYIVIGMFLIISFAMLIRYPGSIIPNNMFVISTEGGEALSEYKSDGTINTLKTAFKMTFFLCVISMLNRKYKKDDRTIWAILSLGMLFLLLGMLTGNSRWVIILNSVIGTYILLQLYPKLRYLIVMSIGTLVVVSFISISIYKFYYMLGDAENPIGTVIEQMLTMFEDYFSGPRLVAQSIEMTKIFRNQITFNTLVNEFVVPIPFIHKLLTNPDDLSNLYFNYYNLGYDQPAWLIIPMLGEGYSLLGSILSPTFTVICEGIGIFFDYRSTIANSYEMKYIFIYTSIWSSLCMGLCSQVIFTWYASTFLAMYILFKLNRKVCL